MLDRSYSKEVGFIIKSLGINANMLARKSNISRDTVMILLNGDRRGKYSTLDKILEAFYISPEWFSRHSLRSMDLIKMPGRESGKSELEGI